jgi:hypothetical protein
MRDGDERGPDTAIYAVCWYNIQSIRNICTAQQTSKRTPLATMLGLFPISEFQNFFCWPQYNVLAEVSYPVQLTKTGGPRMKLMNLMYFNKFQDLPFMLYYPCPAGLFIINFFI